MNQRVFDSLMIQVEDGAESYVSRQSAFTGNPCLPKPEPNEEQVALVENKLWTIDAFKIHRGLHHRCVSPDVARYLGRYFRRMF